MGMGHGRALVCMRPGWPAGKSCDDHVQYVCVHRIVLCPAVWVGANSMAVTGLRGRNALVDNCKGCLA